MKKLKLIIARDDEHGGQYEVNGWALDVPGLAAWNHQGKYMDVAIKRAWQLIHVASGRRIASGYKRKDVERMADAIADVTDWTQERPLAEEGVADLTIKLLGPLLQR